MQRSAKSSGHQRRYASRHRRSGGELEGGRNAPRPAPATFASVSLRLATVRMREAVVEPRVVRYRGFRALVSRRWGRDAPSVREGERA
jgi:hypothetical protein